MLKLDSKTSLYPASSSPSPKIQPLGLGDNYQITLTGSNKSTAPADSGSTSGWDWHKFIDQAIGAIDTFVTTPQEKAQLEADKMRAEADYAMAVATLSANQGQSDLMKYGLIALGVGAIVLVMFKS